MYALGTLGSINHRRNEMFERGRGVAAAAGMDRRGLNNCAARSNEPVKTFTLWQLADRPSLVATTAYLRDRSQMSSNEI